MPKRHLAPKRLEDVADLPTTAGGNPGEGNQSAASGFRRMDAPVGDCLPAAEPEPSVNVHDGAHAQSPGQEASKPMRRKTGMTASRKSHGGPMARSGDAFRAARPLPRFRTRC
jgi:hypothetical protein